MICPVCGFNVANARGLASHFRHQSATHPNYDAWVADRRWEGKVENEDFVCCRECGVRSASLTKHIKVHGMKASDYYAKHGASALLRPRAVSTRIRTGVAAAHAAGQMGHGDTKDVLCPSCGNRHAISKYMALHIHDMRCEDCRVAAAESKWLMLVEDLDFVVCRSCGHRAENLTAHIQNAHPELVGRYHHVYGSAPIVAQLSAVRDKSALRGRALQDETKVKMSLNAGRWNAGLTKEVDFRLMLASSKMQGRVPWNYRSTKDSDPRIAGAASKLRSYCGEKRTWDNGLKAALTIKDFQPYLDNQGTVDRRAAKGLGVSWRTAYNYMGGLGLATSNVHVKARADAATVRLERNDLLPYALGNGKVCVGGAMSGLDRSFYVIKRECERYGLETAHGRIKQTLCLDAVSKALGGASYVQEWKSWAYTNHKTGHRFRFDGYYASVNLIVEFHGYQHYTFPNAFMPDESYRSVWEESCWRDTEKFRLATGAGFFYLVVREDEPYTDTAHLADRLMRLGVGPIGGL